VALCVPLLGGGGGCQRGERTRAEAQQAVAALEKKGEACFAEGRYDCSMEAFAAAAQRQPRRAELWNRFAISARLRYYVTGEADFRDQELEALRRAAKLPSRSEHVQVNLGTACWEMGLREEAAQAYRAALLRAPSHPDATLMRARIQRSTREDDSTEEERSPGP
jgi:tetratricopeptide (TPR) repeat protein